MALVVIVSTAAAEGEDVRRRGADGREAASTLSHLLQHRHTVPAEAGGNGRQVSHCTVTQYLLKLVETDGK